MNVLAFGIGVPGLVDSENGIAFQSVNLPWPETNFKKLIESWTHLPVYVEHDVRCGAIAEKQFGALRGEDHFLYVAIGTGIGAAVGIHGQIYTGSRGKGGELGHMVVMPNGRLCCCGQKGCLEAYCSAKHIELRYEEKTGKYLTCDEILEAAKNGDIVATQVWGDATSTLALSLLNYHMLLEPEIIVIGGGVANAGEDLLRPTFEKMKELASLGTLPKISLSAFKGNSGLIGAGYQAYSRLRLETGQIEEDQYDV